ncbi:MAG: AAA family ATPase [Sulfolobales archaeon]|nr:AAA family ATPase [Sulfolobales archaeon]MDW8082457.1 AAA family ATPase [Sulfolobales archaeon]
MTRVRSVVEKVAEVCGSFLVEREEHVKMLVLAVIAGGHVLVEGIPGVAKTLTAKSAAKAMGLKFSRIQMTPDLLPADIVGSKVFDQKSGDFKVLLGPIHANIVLVDEVNRASPRTQSALLEAMQERQVTIEGDLFTLPNPFTVLATMNPIEVEGVFPLPEAQLDRFLMRLPMGSLSREGMKKLLKSDIEAIEEGLRNLKPVVSMEEILEARKELREVWVDDSLIDYVIRISENLNSHRAVRFGLSPRGAAMLLLLSRALALSDGRRYVIPDDVKLASMYVIPHRIVIKPELVSNGPMRKESLVRDVLSKTEVPRP